MMGRFQVICTMDQIKEAKRNVQKYMRKHKSDEDFIENISNDFVMGFMISQRMAWDDYDNGTRQENDDFGKWIPCSERLPELNIPVLTQWGIYYSGENRIEILRLNELGRWHGDLGEPNGKVIAWMPLPTLYEKGE